MAKTATRRRINAGMTTTVTGNEEKEIMTTVTGIGDKEITTSVIGGTIDNRLLIETGSLLGLFRWVRRGSIRP